MRAEYTYTITARADAVGGGWQLSLLENGHEVGGGAFPLARYDGIPDAACAAYEDALSKAFEWMESKNS